MSRVRVLSDPDHLPALDRSFVIDRPALGLGVDQPSPRILLLYGSLRPRSFSRLCVEEAARLLQLFGAETRIFDPSDLPLPDQAASDDHPAVYELRELSMWSEGHAWCSPERHGQITGVMEAQIDHLPLSMGGMRPTQGRSPSCRCRPDRSPSTASYAALARTLGADVHDPEPELGRHGLKEFGDDDRMQPSSYYDRIFDVMEELVRMTVLMRPHVAQFFDRYFERKEAGVPVAREDHSAIAIGQ